MGVIAEINRIADNRERAKHIASRVIKKGNKEGRKFGDVLQEELKKETRGSLTTFSIANDLAKYFAIIPALFIGLYPGLSALNIMNLHSAESAIFSAIIYNALIIIALIPLALRGVKYREVSAGKLLSRNLLVYGLGGIVVPFIAIKIIDVIITSIGII